MLNSLWQQLTALEFKENSVKDAHKAASLEVQLTLKAVDFAVAFVEHSIQDACDVVKAAGGEVVIVGLVSHGGTGKHDVVPFLSLLPVRAVRSACWTTIML